MLNVQSIHYSYSKKRPILQGINFDLLPGKIYGLLGLNGEGKTTLIKVIAGMLIPQSGQVSFQDLKSIDRSAAYLNEVFFLPDESQIPNLPVIDFGKIYGAFYSRFNQEEYEAHLQEFQIPSDKYTHSLSLGQRRKVHISFALACNTSVLLMDEPSNGLDIPSKTTFRKLLAKSMHEDKTFLISTHQIRDIDQLLEHLLILKNGQIILDKSIDQLALDYKITKAISDQDEVVYQLDELSGATYLIRNHSQVESKLDIEFLFNVINQPSNALVL